MVCTAKPLFPDGTWIDLQAIIVRPDLYPLNHSDMKKCINLLFFFFLVAIAATAQEAPFITRALSKESINMVFARTAGGGIQVSGVSAGEARIEVFITGNNNKSLSKDEINKRLKDDYDLTIEADGGKLTATAEQRNSFVSWRQSLNISFKIYVPTGASTDLGTSGGGISLKDLKGTHNFSTSGGGLNLARITGKVRGKTSGGGIEVTDSRDDISLSTSGGSIHATNCAGTIRLNTSGGQVELTNLDGDIEAKTSGGPIRGESIRGSLYAHTSGGQIKLRNLSCGVDVSTSGGSIDAEIVEVAGAVTVNNSGGNINLRMPSNKGLNLRLRGENISVIDLRNFTGDQDENSVVGKVNGGGTSVNVSTSGNLTFALK